MNALVILLLTLPSLGAVYHVAPAGSDTAAGTAEQPWQTLAQACATAQPGDTVLVHQGSYRETLRPRSGTAEQPITFRAVPGEQVLVLGTDVITGWQPVAGHKGVWSVPWSHRFVINTIAGKPVYHHPNDERHQVIGRPEQAFADGDELTQVLTLDELKPDTFCADPDGGTLSVRLRKNADPNQHVLEASTRSVLCGDGFNPGNPLSHVVIDGFVFRYAANFAQRGAVGIRGTHCQLQNCTIELTAGAGLTVTGSGNLIRNVVCRLNGQIGAGGGGSDNRFERVDFIANNTQGFNAGWEAGGIKVANARDVDLVGCRALGNRGPGLWYDIDNQQCRVSQCQSWDNDGPGIFIEISGPDIAVSDNLCVGNGRADKWGGAGILIAESRGVTVRDNQCYRNRSGLAIRQQGLRRFKGRDGDEIAGHIQDVTFVHNVSADNRLYQFALWWDNPAMGPHPSPDVGLRGDVLEPDEARIKLLDNDLWARPGTVQKAVLWGASWRPKQRTFETVAEADEGLSQAAENLALEPHWQAAEWGDYRLTTDQPLVARGYDWQHLPVGLPTEKTMQTIVLGGESLNAKLLHHETFDNAAAWVLEQQPGATWALRDHKLHITARKGLGTTAWFKPELPANVLIRYHAMALPPHDAANLNAFFAAREPDGSELQFTRDGNYSSYHVIPNYIFTFTAPREERPELGWSRLRRDPGFHLISERKECKSETGVDYAIAIAKRGGHLQVWVDGRLLHDYLDSAPHGAGKYGFRTWSTELDLWDFETFELLPEETQ